MTPTGDRNRKVLLVTHYFMEHGSGIELVAAQVAAYLRQRGGWHITWAASKTCPLRDTPELVDVCQPMTAWNGIQEKTGVPWPVWSPSSILQLWRLVGACDVVHIHDCLYMGNIAAFLFAKLRRKPIVLTQHIAMVPYKRAALRLLMRTAYGVFGRLLFGYSDRVVFISKEVQAELAQRYRIGGDPIFIANGVDVDRFAPARPEDRTGLRTALYGDAGDTPVLLFVGRFVEKKGLPIIRQLAAALPDFSFVMLGMGPLEPETWGLDNVRVVRGLDNAAVADYYRSADLLILPSIGEGLPLVMQEAMSAGVPAMVSTRTAKADPVALEHVYHAPCTDEVEEGEVVEQWTARIRELVADPAALRRGADVRRRFVLENWTWAVCAEKYETIMTALIGEESP